MPCGITMVPARLLYSRGAAGLGDLLASPHLQEVQDILGQLLVVVQHTLQCSRGVSTPKTHSKPTTTHSSPQKTHLEPAVCSSPAGRAPGPAGAAPAL